MATERAMEMVRSDGREEKLEGAREIRRLTKTSSMHRRQLSGAIESLVSMLGSGDLDCNESALLALLNLAVRDERNKIKIVDAGALKPLINFLQSHNSNLQEHATAAILTLSASAVNKPPITTAGAIPLLVNILRDSSLQSKIDSVMALYNLSIHPDNLQIILSVQPVSPIINLLRSCKKSSKTAERCSALLESLMHFDEARNALTAVEGGVLRVVEVLEDGSLQGREHAVGALLAMCESDRRRYREVILKEGAIPGLLELTVQGTPKSQTKARMLLQLLRESPYARSKFQTDVLENIVINIVSQIDEDERSGKAKKMLAEMVQGSMERSLRHLQQRALVCNLTDLHVTNCASEVPLK
ncbi:hypothetical protein QJS10_CPB14g00224 [Acorus calamus]|uniref:U-box domain-containing protein n=1 Tax=Acorus calamus TaxID=4465 RepID=A0AAV9DG11_ACOCL|nr:hypothetical protein QJS10_CPB14g00224 [Acorus calamus]